MAAWHDTPEPLYERLDDRHDEANGGQVFYECSLEELCVAIDRCTDTYRLLADETHQLTRQVEEAA